MAETKIPGGSVKVGHWLKDAGGVDEHRRVTRVEVDRHGDLVLTLDGERQLRVVATEELVALTTPPPPVTRFK